MKAHYDDPTFSYDQYWQGRNYEHQSELLALGKLLKGKTFQSSSDIGGGYGRLTAFLTAISKKTNLIEPSIKQLNLGKTYLKGLKNISLIQGTTQKTKLASNSQDLVIVVRVMHHLPDPAPSFTELYRVLKPDGILVLEFANSLHFKARAISLLTGQPILPTPLDRRSNTNIRRQTIDFVNHHPDSVLKLLSRSGFTIDEILSVSNFRSPFLKKYLPLKFLLDLESFVQVPFSKLFFGPSIFVLAHKVDKS